MLSRLELRIREGLELAIRSSPVVFNDYEDDSSVARSTEDTH